MAVHWYTCPVKYNEVAPIPKQMTIVVGLCVVGLMAFGLALSYYKNVLFDRQLKTMQGRNAKLKSDIATEYGELQYYQSDQYKDKYAKENFSLLRGGEKVFIVKKTNENISIATGNELTNQDREALFEERLRNIRVVDHWKLYLFYRNAIEDLKSI